MTSSLVRKKNGLIAAILIVVILVSGIVLLNPQKKPLDGYRVSIFYDNGVQIQSKIACEHMFRWMGADVLTINRTDIHNGILTSTDLLVMPGGLWSDERCTIDSEADMELVREYVLNGGAYFGIEGGATYATSFRIGLFDGLLYPDVFGAAFYLVDINLSPQTLDMNLTNVKSSYSLLYENSGYFDIDGVEGIIPVAMYENSSYCCMLAFETENGRVFLSSPHPEYEEGSTRDGTDYFDRLHDVDSEWPLMLRITEWLLNM